MSRSRSRSRGRTPTRKSPSRKSPSRKSPSRKSSTRKSSPRKPRAAKALLVEPEANTKLIKEVNNQSEASPPVTRNRSGAQPTRQSARLAKNEVSIFHFDEYFILILFKFFQANKEKVIEPNNIKVDVKSVTDAVESQNAVIKFLKSFGNCYIATMKALPMALFVCSISFIINQWCTKVTIPIVNSEL